VFSPSPEAFFSEFSYGQGPVGRDKVDRDTSFSLYLSINLILQTAHLFPFFHFLNCAPLFSGLHTDPVTQKEQKYLGRSPDKAQATIFSFTLKNRCSSLAIFGSSQERSVARSVCSICKNVLLNSCKIDKS